MLPIRVVAIPTAIAEAVRATLRAPVYGFPAHAELATDDAPCRHCLRTILAGKDRRILFTYDRFAGVESFPQPGPVYVHADSCVRYSEDAGFPDELRASPRTLEAYGSGRRLVTQEYVMDGNFEPVIERLFANPDTGYLQVNSTTAGCFTFRIERASARSKIHNKEVQETSAVPAPLSLALPRPVSPSFGERAVPQQVSRSSHQPIANHPSWE